MLSPAFFSALQWVRDVFRGRIPEYIDREFQAAVTDIVRLTDVPVETVAWFEAHPNA